MARVYDPMRITVPVVLKAKHCIRKPVKKTSMGQTTTRIIDHLNPFRYQEVCQRKL